MEQKIFKIWLNECMEDKIMKALVKIVFIFILGTAFGYYWCYNALTL